MINNPLVSIIIPVYNGSDYLRESINSALAQTYANKEIIVVNDGSNDDDATKNIALSYGSKIRYYVKSNGGVSSALNYGISVMSGEWFSWLSHDDLYLPDKITAEIDCLNKHAAQNEKCAIYCDTEFIDDKGEIILHLKPIAKESEPAKDILLKNLKKNRLGGCSFLIPKEAFSDIGTFAENIRTVSDYDFWYRLLLGGYKFYYLPRTLVQGRMHKKQVTYRMSDLGYKEFNEFHIRLLYELDKRNEYDEPGVFLKIACYSIQRGYMDSAEIAFRMAKNRMKNWSYCTSYAWCIVYGKAYRCVKQLIKHLFVKLRIK